MTMKKNLFFPLIPALALTLTGCGSNCTDNKGHQAPVPEREYVIVVHGGAGEMGDKADDPEVAGKYYAALDSALNIGREVLDGGGNGTEAVKAVIRYFEGNPLFNAGVGATISAEGYFELDAAIMEGKDLSAGAVAGVRHVKHPIDAAYAVKTASPHVMLSGTGADRFAEEQGLETVEDNSYFATPRTMKWVKELQAKSKKNGTVGCVVLDSEGNLTAGTSTGGMFGKKWGRIGDAPVIGAGRHIIFNELNREEGNGGLIAVDKEGNFTMPFNCSGMYRGYLYKEKASGKIFEGYGISEKMIEKQ